MRKLASIQTVTALTPIEGADFIEIAHVLGWKLVVKKGEFQVGDKCVYFELDSYLPIDDKRYEFLRNSSYRNNPIMGEGLRVRTTTLRGQISQGLALPLTIFPELGDVEVGDDVTEALHIRKWDLPESASDLGTQKGDKPFGIHTTDETRVQSMDTLRREMLGKDIVIQGEFCGPTIQKGRIGLKSYEFFVFNIFDKEHKLLGLDKMLAICEELGLKHVPIEERGENFNYTLEELLEKAKGKYPLSGRDKEGIVVRLLEPAWSATLGWYLSFKVLNNDFLKKEK